jgi:catechol 2,3-dioxygenase-like lactoylglutathione lyase family enzyme
MITGVGSAAILVHDAKKSAEWYRDKLGFAIVVLRGGSLFHRKEGHAVFVRPRESQTTLLHLCERCDDWGNDQPGGRTGIWLRCGELTFRKDESTGRIIPASNPANVEKTYSELKKNGVEFSQELTTASWGKMAILRDLDGNEFEIS